MTQIIVLCPHCKKEIEYSTSNPWRPFCSERCKLIDLGTWADEGYKIPIQQNQMEYSEDGNEQQMSDTDNSTSHGDENF